MFETLADPRSARTPPAGGNVPSAIAAARASLARQSAAASDADDRSVDAALTQALLDGPTSMLAQLFAAAPDRAVYRHLWRRLCACAARPLDAGENLGVALFALPLVIVAAKDADGPAALPLSLAGTDAIAALLRAHGALAGSQTFTLAPALVPARALELDALPLVYRSAHASLAAFTGGVAVEAQPLALATHESAHLRFFIGAALCAPHARLLDDTGVGSWGAPLAQSLSREFAVPRASVLVLPRAPSPLPQALAAGKLAQREVSAALFVSNALRRMRASVGEPTAIVSAHRLDDGSGELRLSLSSPFSPRDAEGFRCPLYDFEQVGEPREMLAALLEDCGVTDVRVQPGIHADRDAASGLTLLFKPAPLDA